MIEEHGAHGHKTMTIDADMRFVACNAPQGAVEPAPLSSLPFPAMLSFNATIRAFWATDDRYYLCETRRGVRDRWYCIDGLTSGEVITTAPAVTHAEPDVRALPFPAAEERAARASGETDAGRIVYRVIRGSRRDALNGVVRRGRTRILAVRAAASRRQPS